MITVEYKELEKALEGVFALEMQLLYKDAEINALNFELDLSRRIQEGLRALNNQMLLGGHG